MLFRPGTNEDEERIFSLYTAAVGTEGCTWDAEYPTLEILRDDIRREAVFVMERDGEIIGAISIDDDPLTDVLPVWDPELCPAAEISRVVVSGACRGCGIAPAMFCELHEVLRHRNYRSAHYLVSPDNKKALHAYESLGYQYVGEADVYDHHWYCYERTL